MIKSEEKNMNIWQLDVFIFVSLDSHHVNLIIMFVPFLILDLLV